MGSPTTVLLLGGTGRTGRRVLTQLLERGVTVRALVRSAGRLPEGALGAPGLTVTEAEVASLPDGELQGLLQGCDGVISCLGHTTTPGGVLGPPRDLVTRAIARVCGAARSLSPAEPVKLVVMSSVSVNVPDGRDARRGALEKAAVWALRGLVPPAKDNQRAADFLREQIGEADPSVRWVVVRPDTLVDGDVSGYALHEGLVSSLARPDQTAMSNVAHFMCELVTDSTAWRAWQGRLPVIVDAVSD
ncbi:MAG: NAD(P)-dependent oxidoreductase [Coriobacteriia bacterium]